ncbi:transcription-repair coupling factor [Tyzzerella sp. An114]|uniref:transcription-repair coupling factor n=1 Tax=Tyzzerella sp. An114 TaxID=1965545 RepID=UPI000B431381|nr:transcription-repair coupling factor [Tyzzerella sp. An114]OUQ58533.1 transcription-repair coupling factor [Tyzzerella sp. An114]HIT72465.1 transcription-repair coupling factor [Candidatus Fimicola cottocaccae]
MNTFVKPLLELEGFKKLNYNVQNNVSPVLVTGVVDVQKNHIVGALREITDTPALIITHNELRAKEICNDMQFFDKNCMYYPSKDILFYSADVRSDDIVRKRLSVIDMVMKNERPTVVLSAEALFDRLLNKSEFEKYIITLKEGDVINVGELCERLVLMGYERNDITENRGSFSVRGGIIDIFSPIEETAVRIELWDDEIDSIRLMDADTQRSIEKVDETKLFPVREMVYGKKELENALKKIKSELKICTEKYAKKGHNEEAERLLEYINEDIEKFSEDKSYGGAVSYIQYFYENTVSLIDYMPENTVIYFDEPQRIAEHSKNIFDEYSESIKSRIEKGYLLPNQSTMVFDYHDILKFAEKKTQILFTTVTVNIKDFNIKDIINIAGKTSSSFSQRLDLFCDEISYLKNNGYRVLILAGAQTRCERFVRELSERGIESYYTTDFEGEIQKGSVAVMRGRLGKGFEYPDIKFAVFSESELFGDVKKKKTKKKNKKGSPIESFTDLKVGDYVVHESHGIGVYRGLEKIVVEGISKDYMKISYSDGGNLFVPVNQMDLIQKYIGNGGARPKLNKLGSQEWSKAKNKVRSAVKVLAQDLVMLYAKRQATKGFQYSEDNMWQREFEESFPYDETEDQLLAIEDVKRDMEGTQVMDRLICGDVGYGKTEVAIRAAFKAVQDGKQVAYLVPTTILAQQHYNTFCQRMADYPVRVDLLSRFRTPKQQKETLNALEKGYADIVIGTHRILSKDVKFKDLGLIIVDEEQRFGVNHKEKLKTLKENVDVLTLTATPIPRTLHMSLAGIRDMSVLEEPPQERRPVQTYVLEDNPEFVKEAINRELVRGGQVYYLNNRVHNIAEVALKIQNLVPDAVVAYAHGQMTERELERIMSEFIEGEIDVLVCTTIIETGLDISNVNTIIIQDADYMGLSQLYQLRGRVGRSNKIAYAYLMYKRDKVLNEVAEKRLQTIREFTEFGSGFKVAMRDLELRGAGNLLGAEQHGHMESVGYDMYCKLLDEAVRKLKGEEVSESFETSMDIDINAFIPDFYIHDEKQRLEIYKKISLVSSMENYYDIQEEIEDRYGDIPKSVQNLLEVVLVKAEAHKRGVTNIVQKGNNIVITFKPDAKIDPVKLTELINKNKSRYLFTSGANPYLTIKTNPKEKITALTYIKNVLQDL